MKKKIQALCASLFMGILLFMAGVQTFAEPSYTSKFSDWGNLLKQYANDENGNEMIYARGKENKRILCGVAIAYLGYGVCYSVSQKDLGYLGVAFLFGLIFYAIRVMCVLLRMAAKREKRSLKNDLIVLAVLLVGFIAGMMLPYDKEEEAKRTAESVASVMEKAALPLAGLDYTLDDVN